MKRFWLAASLVLGLALPSGVWATTAVSPQFGSNILLSSPYPVPPDTALIQSQQITNTTLWFYLSAYLDSNGNLNTSAVLNLIGNIRNNTRRPDGKYLDIRLHLMTSSGPGLFSLPGDLAAYSKQVTQLAQTLKANYPDMVWNYSVGNELGPLTFTGTVADYGTLIQTTYTAVKAGDPTAKVLDSGASSESNIGDYGSFLESQGKISEAIDFVNGYSALHKAGLGKYLPVTDQAGLDSLLADPSIAGVIPFNRERFTTWCPYYDVLQLHLYNGWAYMGTILDYVASQQQSGNCVKPIEIWEMGYMVDNRTTDYNLTNHAKDAAKSVVINSAKNARLLNYVTYYDRDSGFATGLWACTGTPTCTLQSQPPGVAFEVSATQLTGATGVDDLSTGSYYLYKFTKPTGTVFAAWSKSATVNLDLNLGTVSNLSIVHLDNTTTSSPSNAIPLDDSPVFILLPGNLNGDINKDGKVDIIDLAMLVNKRTATSVTVPPGTPEDLDGDNVVDGNDLAILLANYTSL